MISVDKARQTIQYMLARHPYNDDQRQALCKAVDVMEQYGRILRLQIQTKSQGTTACTCTKYRREDK